MKVTGWKVRKIGRVEGGKVGRSEGGKVGRSKPKPHGSLYLPQFLPYTFLTKISGGDLWSPPTNKSTKYTPLVITKRSERSIVLPIGIVSC